VYLHLVIVGVHGAPGHVQDHRVRHGEPLIPPGAFQVFAVNRLTVDLNDGLAQAVQHRREVPRLLRHLARLLRVDRIVVAEGIYNTANEGQTASMSFIAPKAALLCYVDPNPGQNSLTAGATFTWTGMPGGAGGTVIEKWYDRSIKSDCIDGFANWSMKVVAADAGVYFTTIVQ